MTSEFREDTPCWFVLNHIATTFQNQAEKEVDRFNRGHERNLELFAPTYVVREVKDGEVRMKSINLTFHYVFVRGTFSDVKFLCSQPNGFSFLLDRSAAVKYAVISDRDMTHFKNIARAYKNCLPYFSLEDIDLEDGDLVEVINGDMPGLIGVYIPKPKSKTGDIVLSIYNKVGTIAFDIKAKDVRVLEFSKNYTRVNDQIDAFVPHLLKALRLFHSKEAIPNSVLAKLSVFCSRMEVAKLNNRKLNAKLQALLYGGNYILGRISAAEQARATYGKIRDSVTNEWTKALINLIFSVIENNHERMLSMAPTSLDATSKAQLMVIKEYQYYLSATALPIC